MARVGGHRARSRSVYDDQFLEQPVLCHVALPTGIE